VDLTLRVAIFRVDLKPEEIDELLTINVIVLIRVKILKQAVCLNALHSISAKEVVDLAARNLPVVIRSQIAEGLPHIAELLGRELCD
jgi:hypothetical protein